MYIICFVCMYFVEGHHGNRGGAHRLGQSATPSGALFLLGHAGLGLVHSRYEAQEESWLRHMHSCSSSMLTLLSPFS